MQWRSWSYKPVGLNGDSDPEADEKDAGPVSLRPRPSTSANIIPLATTITAVLFLVLFVFMPRPWLPSDHQKYIRYFDCGNSTEDASAAGCKFDVMSYTWVHPKCFDQELMYDFLGLSEWTWYGDEDGTQALALNEVAQGQHEYVYVTWKHYTAHCTYSE